ncbi:hypothetical protein ACQJBY_042465 [Aegilops geniculata]
MPEACRKTAIVHTSHPLVGNSTARDCGHGSGHRCRFRLLAVPRPLQERPRPPSHGNVESRRRHGRRHRRHLQGRRHRRRRRPDRAAVPAQGRPAVREAPRPRLLPRGRLRRPLGLLRHAPPLPQRPRGRGRRRRRVRRLPPRARAPAPGRLRRRVGGARLGPGELRARRAGAVAGRARRRRARLRRGRQRRRQHRAQHGNKGRRQRQRAAGGRADRRAGAPAPVLPRQGSGAVGGRGPQVPAEGGEVVGLRVRGEVRDRPPVHQPAGDAGGGVGGARLPASTCHRGGAGHDAGQGPDVRAGAEGERVDRGGGGPVRDRRRGARLLPGEVRLGRQGGEGDGRRRLVHQAELGRK